MVGAENGHYEVPVTVQDDCYRRGGYNECVSNGKPFQETSTHLLFKVSL